MRSRRATSTALAVVALALAVAQLVWTVAFLGGSGDGAAFVAVLLGMVLTPSLVAVASVLLIPRIAPRTIALVALFTACTGVATAAVVAGVFVGDEPGGPGWIGRVADADPIAAFLAVLLAASLAWRLLPIRSTTARFFAAVPIAAIGTAITALLLLQTTIVWLMAAALVVVLVVLRVRGRTPARSVGR